MIYMKDLRDKPVHELCVDKTSCRHETTLDEAGGNERKAGFTPTGHMTKDVIRKAYEEQVDKGRQNR
jgi:hypothetical protein